MKNIDEKILMAEEEIKQLQNKRKKLISQQKQEERKKRDRRLYEKGAVFESIFNENKFPTPCVLPKRNRIKSYPISFRKFYLSPHQSIGKMKGGFLLWRYIIFA